MQKMEKIMISKYRVHHVTLLEVLIALSLAVIVLTTLNFFYRQIDSINVAMEKVQRESFQMAYIENRLSNIIPKAVFTKIAGAKNDFYFFTGSDVNGLLKEGSPSLVFTFDNGVNLDKPFSNHVLGRLYLDKKGNFCLATMPSPLRWEKGGAIPIKDEILLQNVESIAFRYYAAPERNRSKISTAIKATVAQGKEVLEISPKDHWYDSWKYEYRQLPAIVKIILKQRVDSTTSRELTFSFPMPNSEMVVVYDK
jgi:type II secretory pathway component PulJ